MYKVTRLDIGITTRCNAGCPQCDRTDHKTGKAWDFLKHDELRLEDFKRLWPSKSIPWLYMVNFCGSIGDPLVAKDIIPIIEYLCDVDNPPQINIATNGSMKKPVSWWHDLGRAIQKSRHPTVIFGLDGIDQETHSKYRVNTDFNLILRNVSILQMYGIRCIWQFLVFNYNHQYLEQARQMSKDLGFYDFKPVSTTRQVSGPEQYEFLSPEGYFSPGNGEEYNIFNDNEVDYITCSKAADINQIHINAYGYVFPCCFVESRFLRLFYANDLKRELGKDLIASTIHEYEGLFDNVNLDDLNIRKNSIDDILAHPWWDRLLELHKELKPQICFDVCGKCKE